MSRPDIYETKKALLRNKICDWMTKFINTVRILDILESLANKKYVEISKTLNVLLFCKRFYLNETSQKNITYCK